MTTEEVKAVVAEEVKKAMEPVVKQLAVLASEEDGGKEGGTGTAGAADVPAGDISADIIAKMVGEEIKKAMEPVVKTLEPVMKSRSLPGNLNDAAGTVEKQEQHYLHGII